ncbi:hypothetical protein LTR37_000715 [Vermiconidia calcicola]|uniref:Uncharacterized protein n=1 Tax=Vermiconidia calcicola TaxID=1690605 RepID=A0ACC3NY01_9PEZI|nr:hypothetical protein LTR37_000715 [Vermiconidia calcicola]
MSSSNHIKKVAIVGAGGNSGSYMTKALLETGKHTVTAITRAESNSKFPEGVEIKQVDYEDISTIVDALRGQDALVITLSVFAHGQQEKLIQAAADANVPWVLPNEWSPDTDNAGLVKDIGAFQEKPKIRAMVQQLGKSSYISVVTGFWYEWSLSIPLAYGIDSLKHEATLFDEGDTMISTSTWPQVGRAVAGLLSLPIRPEGDDKDRCLERFRNGLVYVSSFTVSQKDMLESALRVTGTKMDDWKIIKESSSARYDAGSEAMKGGDRMGFIKLMYTRVFYPDGSGNFEQSKGTANELLELPREDLDEATKAAIERQKNSSW